MPLVHPSLRPKLVLMASLNVAFFWEITEHYLETGFTGEAVVFWLQGVENWSNRMIADNIMVLLGALAYLRKPSTIVPVRIVSGLWLFAHIFLFPHSMYLQNLLIPDGIGCWPG